jgi:hypothetical protein
VPRGTLPIQDTIIDLSLSSPADSKANLLGSSPGSRGDSFRANTPIPSSLRSRGTSPLVTEELVPSAVPNVVAPTEFDSFFEDNLQEVRHYVAEPTTPSTVAGIQPAQPASTVLLPLKEVEVGDNSTVPLLMWRFLDGLRAAPQGLTNWLRGESKRTSIPSKTPASTPVPSGDMLAEENPLSETLPYSEYEVSTTLIHGGVGTPGVKLVSWSSVIDQPTTSVPSMDMDLQQRMTSASSPLQDDHFSMPTSAPTKLVLVEPYRRWSGVIAAPSELSNYGNVSRH